MISFRPQPQLDLNAAIFFVDENQWEKKEGALWRKPHLDSHLALLKKTRNFRGQKDEMFPLQLERTLVLLVGLGIREDITGTSLRILVRQAIFSPFLKDKCEIEIIPHDPKDQVIRDIIEGILIGGYIWNKYQTTAQNAKKEKSFYVVSMSKKIFTETITVCEGVNYARDLINDNADLTTSDFLEDKVKALIKKDKRIRIEVLGKKGLQAKGLNLHLAVNQGSAREPKLIIISYQGASQKVDFTALVGKGLTFDTGGLNLKPTGHIETMRCDMSGAAAVMGCLKNTLSLNIKKNVIFTIGIAENAIGPKSYKPGDVLVSYSGKTVEIGNTDAEGRLVLADAMAYLVKNYRPQRIIDIATLTGACTVALGHDYSGLVANDNLLAQRLLSAAQETDDRVWQMPSYPEIAEAVKSTVADIKNVGYPKGAAGVLTAAEFLRQFVGDTPWAHLDIAGTAFVESKSRLYFNQGATGSGVRLLTAYLQKS